MNRKQKKALLAGAVAVALMTLFPPWNYFDGDTSGRRSAGYHFILAPPAIRPAGEVFGPPRFPHMVRVRPNILRLLLQLVIAIPALLGLAILWRRERSVISIVLGIALTGFALVVFSFAVWMVVNDGLNYGRWRLP